MIQTALIFATLYFLWHGLFAVALGTGLATAGIAIHRDRTDNRWVTKPWRDGDDGGMGTGGCSTRGI